MPVDAGCAFGMSISMKRSGYCSPIVVIRRSQGPKNFLPKFGWWVSGGGVNVFLTLCCGRGVGFLAGFCSEKYGEIQCEGAPDFHENSPG